MDNYLFLSSEEAKLFLPFLCEGEHHIVPPRMNIFITSDAVCVFLLVVLI